MMLSCEHSKPYILYIEDDSEDVELLKYALADTQFNFDVMHLHNGAEALTFLNESKDFHRLPEMILLDINMPRLNGKETFVCLKADINIARIPLAVVSTSTDVSDKEYFRRYEVPYVVKPGDIDRYKEDLVNAMKNILSISYDFRSTRSTDAA